jgi:predicted transcriptional regulator
MTSLTKAEEEVMHIIWRLERCLVSDILPHYDELKGKPTPQSSVSSIVRILEEKGFVSHKAYGRTYEYFPIVSKEDYSKTSLNRLVSDYFEGSMSNLVSFLVKEEKLDKDELSELIEKLK